MTNIKAIFFDVDNTLLDFDLGAKTLMANLLEERGKKFEDEMFSTFTRINNGLWKTLERGEITKDELYAVRWNRVFEAIGIDGIDGPDFEKYFKSGLHESAFLIDGATEILAYLKPKYRLFAATNGGIAQQTNRLEKSNLLGYFDGIFASEAIGFPKPTKEFFDKCFENAGGIKPEETLMIGDSPSADIIGAKNYGMKTLRFRFGNNINLECKEADAEVYKLADIRNFL